MAHQYYIAGQSGGLSGSRYVPDAEAENPAPSADPLATGDYTETIDDIQGDTAGCTPTSKSVRTVNMLLTPPPQTPTPAPTLDNGTTFSPPCEDYNTILDEIGSVEGNPPFYDWQYIAMDNHNIWAAPLGVFHLFNQYTGNLAIQPFAVDPDAENFVLNVTGSTSPTPNPGRPFAALTYITPCVNESDHPLKANEGNDDGPAWLGWLINAIGESQYWNSTAIIVTWDDWGGWYDKDPPVPTPGPVRPFPNNYGNNPQDPNEWGFRVPLIVISPYIKQRGYISNLAHSGFQWRSQSVILQYVEHTFGLSQLGGDDLQQGQTDELHDIFNYSASPLPYIPIPTPSFVPGQVGSCPSGNGPLYRRPLKALRKPFHVPLWRATPASL